MANINKIRVSGTTYDIQDSNAPKTVELTQAQYDALVTGGTVDPNTFYIITDATAGDLSNYYTKSETSGATEISTALASKADKATTYTKTEVDNAITAATSTKQDTLVSGTNVKTINNESILGEGNITIEGGGSSYTAGDGIDITNDVISVTGKVDTTAFTAHTADTVIHVTSTEKAAWNAKSDFSGDYNDLTNKPTIPTVPTSNTAFTNDAGYITSSALDGYATTGDVQTATNDMATKTWVGQQGYLTQHQDISGKQDVSGMTAYTTTATTSALNDVVTAHTANTSIHVSAEQIAAWNAKSDFSGSYNDLTNKLSAGTNVTIIDNVISAEGGGGKAIVGGRGITVTSGETANTVSFNLPISAGTNSYNLIIVGERCVSNGSRSIATGFYTKAQQSDAFAQGYKTDAGQEQSHAEGYETKAYGVYSHSEGRGTSAMTAGSHAEGIKTITSNSYEHSQGWYNVSNKTSNTFGDSGNTLFSVGNGTADNARHNAFEIRQNGDIYLNDGSKLQDTVSATTANTTALGGLKLVKLSQSEYDSLATKDNSTLYVVTDS